ncbi:MAG TPA: sugar ABC transporter permease [Actinomycetota bacterium]|jgi:alpha-glucoside transport system permease protein|nr:sugar ABC transporter permease [Actinomycetota bacterium]
MAGAFLAPAALLLGALVVYPTIDTIAQSFQANQAGYPWQRDFVGFEHYQAMFSNQRILTAIKNNAIWVATAPAIITGLGLMFALLTERVRYSTAVKVVVFMPMAISFLATGVIWRLMYEEDRQRGLINATLGAAADAVSGPGPYAGANVLPQSGLEPADGGGFATTESVEAGGVARLALTAILEEEVPEEATQAQEPEVGPNEVGAVVWRDFKPGGGEVGVVEQDELGLPAAEVQLIDANGDVVATEQSESDGTVVFEEVEGGPFTLRLAPSNFATGFAGVSWLGPSLATPAIIGAFCWMWAGFAVVVIGAGLAALPRDVLEAARVDGANEWQTFRHVTLPLLAPVLGVVFVTLLINVLKIFDIVYVMALGAVQNEANVIALEMYRTAFGATDFGAGSAIAVLLFILVVPVMVLNIKRFRRDV